MRLLLVLLVVCFAASDLKADPPRSYGPQPSLVENKGGSPGQAAEQAQADPNKQTEATPTVGAGSAGTPPDQIGAANPSEDNNGDAGGQWWEKPDWWIAGLTVLLLCVAGGQLAVFYWQLSAMRQGVIDSGKAANAAAANAEATRLTVENFRIKEQARLTADATVEYHRLEAANEAGVIKFKATITISFFNFGDTSARIGKTRLGIVIANDLADRISLQTLPGVQASPRYFQTPIPPHQWGGAQEFAFEFSMTKQGLERMNAADQEGPKLFVIGSVRYKDVFDDARTFVFAMKRKNSAFVHTRGEHYNRDHTPYYEGPEEE